MNEYEELLLEIEKVSVSPKTLESVESEKEGRRIPTRSSNQGEVQHTMVYYHQSIFFTVSLEA